MNKPGAIAICTKKPPGHVGYTHAVVGGIRWLPHICEQQVLGPRELQIHAMSAVPVNMRCGNQACWRSLCNSLYFFGYFFLQLNCFCVLVGLQGVTPLEEITKVLFEMQEVRFSKEKICITLKHEDQLADGNVAREGAEIFIYLQELLYQ